MRSIISRLMFPVFSFLVLYFSIQFLGPRTGFIISLFICFLLGILKKPFKKLMDQLVVINELSTLKTINVSWISEKQAIPLEMAAYLLKIFQDAEKNEFVVDMRNRSAVLTSFDVRNIDKKKYKKEHIKIEKIELSDNYTYLCHFLINNFSIINHSIIRIEIKKFEEPAIVSKGNKLQYIYSKELFPMGPHKTNLLGTLNIFCFRTKKDWFHFALNFTDHNTLASNIDYGIQIKVDNEILNICENDVIYVENNTVIYPEEINKFL